MGKPFLPDPALYLQAGINPKTLKPIRLCEDGLKSAIKAAFRIIDEQDFVNRYKWFNIPMNLSSEEIERMLYYKGHLAFFEMEGQFYLMPYALEGTIDFYGRYNQIHPVPMASGGTDKASETDYKAKVQFLSTIKKRIIKAPIPFEDLKIEDLNEGAVILYDYTKQLSQSILPRAGLNDPFVDLEAEILPYMGTALLAGTGIKGLRVNDADAAEETDRASAQIRQSALSKKLYVAITHNVEFQELADGTPMKSEEFLLALQSIDNIRKGTLGIENGGIFQKKAHKLESEQTGNESSVATVFQDGLSQRQHFCNIVNSIWGTSLWCEPSEAVLGQDLNLDGANYDVDQGDQTGFEDSMNEGGNDNE